ncbi:hypothetical protein GCM10027589_19580 [Actinocorallia lasiicapitis]
MGAHGGVGVRVGLDEGVVEAERERRVFLDLPGQPFVDRTETLGGVGVAGGGADQGDGARLVGTGEDGAFSAFSQLFPVDRCGELCEEVLFGGESEGEDFGRDSRGGGQRSLRCSC